MSEIQLDRQQFLEFEKVAIGAFAPLRGFMNGDEFSSVVNSMRLPDGTPFPLPVILPVEDALVPGIKGSNVITLLHEGEEVGSIAPEEVYRPDLSGAVPKIFGATDDRHPGVHFFKRMPPWFVAGPVRISERAIKRFSGDAHTPQEAVALWKAKGWQRVAGFQTRNVPHRAHEYLIRLALETMDGVLVQPLVGRRKAGDYTTEAILAGYRALIGSVLPADRVEFGVLSTWMRYAGPREAVFHAIIRRNYGCTHFIVGRDHAGVGDYYGLYDAHELTRRFDGELGIEILRYCGPFYCRRCGGIATERTCAHFHADPSQVEEISGTMIRRILSEDAPVAEHLFRPEVAAAIRKIQPLFVEEN